MLSLAPAASQFPRRCASRVALLSRECCPAWDGDGSACGVRSGRGFCADVDVEGPTRPHGPQYPFSGLDDRERWPLVFFNRTCRCAGPFMGPDCSDCSFGYFGADCGQRRESLRRNVLHLSRAERRRLVSYLNLAKTTHSPDYVVATGTYREMENGSRPLFADVSSYDVFVWMHYYVSRDALMGAPGVPGGDVWSDVDFAHWAPGFLPWHRLYLLHWEHDIRKLTGDMTFALPYWDWRDAAGCDVCTDELMGGPQPPGPGPAQPRVMCSRPDDYNSRGVLCDAQPEGPLRRNPGNHNRAVVPRLPTSADVDFTLGLEDYDTPPLDRTANMSFRNTMEGFGDPQTGLGNSSQMGMHAALHVFMNGTMSSVQGSANDPLFLLHHAFIDSLYEQWLRRHQPSPSQYPASGAPIGHNGDYNMVPFLPLHTNAELFVSSKQLGYEYSSLLDANQRLAESMTPYLERLQDTWPWLVLVGLLGAVLPVLLAAVVTATKRYRRHPSWWSGGGWRRSSQLVLPEREPLLSAGAKQQEQEEKLAAATIWVSP
ncbi:hypothetical protein CRUP_000131 [Coryphaenoides rupestris]|nr:hypothetical protein CRUP_000131 [Coryphaenoides rupestris]